jgi:NADPH-dependent 2,4-dienoyl-CoA reductase/sulfur reductase-like enzyme
MLRREGYEGPITMLSAEDAPPSDRPNLSKDYLAGEAQDDWIPLRSPEYFTERRIELLLGSRVSAIDVKARQVLVEGGAPHPFGALLIATGADPVRPPIPGAGSSRVHYLRSFADSRALVEKAGSARRARRRGRRLHRTRSVGVAASAGNQPSTWWHRDRRRSSASWGWRSDGSFKRCTKRTASSSISARR